MSSYKDHFVAHVEGMLANSSCHGGNWVLKLKSFKTKSAGSLLIFLLQSLVVFVLLYQLCIVEKDFTTSIQWQNENLTFPNITICNPRLFDKEKVQSLNLTDELLAYIFFPIGIDNADLWRPIEHEYLTSSKILESYNFGGTSTLANIAIK